MKAEIKQVTEEEAGSLQRMTEIRFDCFVRMYEMKPMSTVSGFIIKQEHPRPPQWFRSQNRLTLEAIKYGDEQEIGRQIKFMLYQLEDHIKRYEDGTIAKDK